jgi:hypothetical protein
MMEKTTDTTTAKAATPTPRTRGKRTTPPATTTSEAYLNTVMAALDCNDPAQLAEKAQRLQEQVESLNDQAGTLQLALVEKGNDLSAARGGMRDYAKNFNECFAVMDKTLWGCAKPDELPGKIRGLVAGWELAKKDTEYFQRFVLKTCDMLGTNGPNLIEEKLQLVLSRKDELDNLTRTAQLCLLPQWRPAKRENLAEAITNLCDSWSANVERVRDMDKKNADLKRESAHASSEWETWRKAALKAEDALRDTKFALTEATCEAERLRPVLPFWARALAGVVWTATVFAIAHKMGFEAHAIIGGGK